MSIVFIGLGSNLGEKVDLIKKALDYIDNFEKTQIIKISKFYLTKPQEFVSDSMFVNAVAKIKTSLSLEDFFYRILAVEKQIGRSKDSKSDKGSYKSRLIDIDILFYDNVVYSTDELVIPHIKMHTRNFVLIPFQDIEPDFIHPKLGITIRQIQENIASLNKDFKDSCKEIEYV